MSWKTAFLKLTVGFEPTTTGPQNQSSKAIGPENTNTCKNAKAPLTPQLIPEYQKTDETDTKKSDYDYKISLTTTPCHFGGVRYWFICPLSVNGVYCGRCVGTLYLASGGHYFGCRHCYSLTYESPNKPRFARPDGIGYQIKAERLYEELYKKTERWTYKGKLTKKARTLQILDQKRAGILDVYDTLLKV